MLLNESARSLLNHVTTLPRDFSVRMPGRHGNRSVGVLVELRTSGPAPVLRAEFPPPGTPLMAMGSRVPLEIEGPALEVPLAVEGRTVLWTSSATAFTYGFEVERAFVATLYEVADRRFARRVLLPAEARVEVALSAPGGPAFRGWLKDVSIGGAGVHVTREADGALLSAYELRVAIGLPEPAGPLDLRGRTRSRTLVDELVRIGIQFDPERSEDVVRQMGLLENFVAAGS